MNRGYRAGRQRHGQHARGRRDVVVGCLTDGSRGAGDKLHRGQCVVHRAGFLNLAALREGRVHRVAGNEAAACDHNFRIGVQSTVVFERGVCCRHRHLPRGHGQRIGFLNAFVVRVAEAVSHGLFAFTHVCDAGRIVGRECRPSGTSVCAELDGHRGAVRSGCSGRGVQNFAVVGLGNHRGQRDDEVVAARDGLRGGHGHIVVGDAVAGGKGCGDGRIVGLSRDIVMVGAFVGVASGHHTRDERGSVLQPRGGGMGVVAGQHAAVIFLRVRDTDGEVGGSDRQRSICRCKRIVVCVQSDHIRHNGVGSHRAGRCGRAGVGHTTRHIGRSGILVVHEAGDGVVEHRVVLAVGTACVIGRNRQLDLVHGECAFVGGLRAHVCTDVVDGVGVGIGRAARMGDQAAVARHDTQGVAA